MGEGDFVQRVVWPACRLVLHLLITIGVTIVVMAEVHDENDSFDD